MLQITTNMTAGNEQPELWNAVLSRDASRDGSLSLRCARRGFIGGHPAPRGGRAAKGPLFSSTEAAEQAGFRPVAVAIHARPDRRSAGRLVRRICHAIDEHDEEPLTLKNAQHGNRRQRTSPATHFQKRDGHHARQYAESRRLDQFKSRVKEGASVTEAMYDAGMDRAVVLREVFGAARHDAATYGRGGQGMRIIYTIAACPLVGCSSPPPSAGVCSVALGDSDAELSAALFAEYPNRIDRFA